MEDFLKAIAEEASKLQCELNLELKITLSDGRVITKSATSEVEARNIIRYFHEEERKLQYELLRKNNPDMTKVLTNLRDEIVDICEDYCDDDSIPKSHRSICIIECITKCHTSCSLSNGSNSFTVNRKHPCYKWEHK